MHPTQKPATNFDVKFKKMNKWEKACKEFLKGCSCTKIYLQEECEPCLKAFLNHIRKLALQEKESQENVKRID